MSNTVYRHVRFGAKCFVGAIVGMHGGKAYPCETTIWHMDRRGRKWPKQVARTPVGVVAQIGLCLPKGEGLIMTRGPVTLEPV